MTHPEVTSRGFISRLRAAWRVLFPRAVQAQTPFPEITPFSAGGYVPRVPERRAPQPDERCGFPLHLPFGAHHVAIHGDRTECVDCGQQWDTNDPAPPERCMPRRPLGGFNEDHVQ